METCFILTLTFFISLLLKPILSLLLNTKKLPPGSATVPIIDNFLWLCKSFWQLKPFIRKLQSQYGPIITLHIGSCPAIFISNHSLAHQVLIQNGAIFADRPTTMATNQLNISFAVYDPTWHLLRRNLTFKILLWRGPQVGPRYPSQSPQGIRGYQSCGPFQVRHVLLACAHVFRRQARRDADQTN